MGWKCGELLCFFPSKKKHMFEAGAARLFQSWRCVFTSHPKVHENAQNAYFSCPLQNSKKIAILAILKNHHCFLITSFSAEFPPTKKKNVVSTKISTRPPCRRVTLAAGSAGSKPTSRAQGAKRTKGACGSIIGDDKGFPSLHGPPSN